MDVVIGGRRGKKNNYPETRHEISTTQLPIIDVQGITFLITISHSLFHLLWLSFRGQLNYNKCEAGGE